MIQKGEKLCNAEGQGTSQCVSDPPCVNKVGKSNTSIRYCLKFEAA